jgi:hypothetical protein
MQKYNIPTVHVSTDYSEFEFFPSNRPADKWVKIAQSIEKKDLTRFNPIITVIINGKKYIGDGQNRFVANKHLGLPIYHFIATQDEFEEKDISLLNVNQTNWSLNDFMSFYVSHGYPEYVKLSQLKIEMPLFSLHDFLKVWQSGGKKESNWSTSEGFKSGLYTISKEGLLKLRRVYSVLNTIYENCDGGELKNRGSLVSGISKITLSENFSYTHMVDQIRKYSHLFVAQGDAIHYADHLEYIYNYRKRNENKVSLKYAS